MCSSLREHHGVTPVYIVCEDTGKRLEAPKHLRASVTEGLLNELYETVGEKNTKFVK